MIHALMPAIHDRQTGGSIYNRQVLEYLARSTPVQLHLDAPDADLSQWSGGVWLVDSLCLERGAALLASCPSATGVLLAHYLAILDPRRRHSGRVSAEAAHLKRYRGIVTTSRFAECALLAAGYEGTVATIPPGLAPPYRAPVRTNAGGRSGCHRNNCQRCAR